MITIAFTESEAAFMALAACLGRDGLTQDRVRIQEDFDLLISGIAAGMIKLEDIHSAGKKLRDALYQFTPTELAEKIYGKQQHAEEFPLPMGATPRDPKLN